MRVSLIAAVARNGAIGVNNALPWRLPTDQRRFRWLTLGKPIVMGRLTYESIGRPLDGRTNIVVTRDAGYSAPDCRVVDSLEAALDVAEPAPEVMVIGGAAIYALALPLADRIYLTRVDADVEGDASFPDLPDADWREVESTDCPAGPRDSHDMRFVTLERVH